MQYEKNVLLNDIVLEGKAVIKFFLADQVEYWFNLIEIDWVVLQIFKSKIFDNLINEAHLSIPSPVS